MNTASYCILLLLICLSPHLVLRSRYTKLFYCYCISAGSVNKVSLPILTSSIYRSSLFSSAYIGSAASILISASCFTASSWFYYFIIGWFYSMSIISYNNINHILLIYAIQFVKISWTICSTFFLSQRFLICMPDWNYFIQQSFCRIQRSWLLNFCNFNKFRF